MLGIFLLKLSEFGLIEPIREQTRRYQIQFVFLASNDQIWRLLDLPILVVDSESRGLGIGSRIAKELLARLLPGETVEAEVQREPAAQRRTARFFERLGFKCVNERYRTGDVPRYVSGAFKGTVQRNFALYAFTR